MSIKRYKIAILPIIIYSIVQIGNPPPLVSATQFELGDFKFYESSKAPVRGLSDDTPTPSSQVFAITSNTEDISIQVSKDLIDFGELSAGEPFLRSVKVRVPSVTTGRVIYLSENHAPISTKAQLPNTRCDEGNCTEIIAASWDSPLTYGFGYRCDNGEKNTGCASDFSEKKFYRQFADESSKKSAEVVATTESLGSNSEFYITYKINIASSQELGGYQNTTTMIALPKL